MPGRGPTSFHQVSEGVYRSRNATIIDASILAPIQQKAYDNAQAEVVPPVKTPIFVQEERNAHQPRPADEEHRDEADDGV